MKNSRSEETKQWEGWAWEGGHKQRTTAGKRKIKRRVSNNFHMYKKMGK